MARQQGGAAGGSFAGDSENTSASSGFHHSCAASSALVMCIPLQWEGCGARAGFPPWPSGHSSWNMLVSARAYPCFAPYCCHEKSSSLTLLSKQRAVSEMQNPCVPGKWFEPGRVGFPICESPVPPCVRSTVAFAPPKPRENTCASTIAVLVGPVSSFSACLNIPLNMCQTCSGSLSQ